MRKIIVAATLAGAVLTSFSSASACTVCHSKNPKMVRMHEALEYKDCFTCHGPAANRKHRNEKNEMITDLLCTNCHAPEAQKTR